MSRSLPDDWNQRRRKVYKRDNYTCQSCGRKGGRGGGAELHAHHILPRSKGGSDRFSNLVTLCDRCHAEYHDDPRLLSGTETATSENALRGHRKVALLTAWWTFGGGNLVYELIRRSRNSSADNTKKKREEGLKRLEKKELERKQNRAAPNRSRLRGHWKVFLYTGWWSFGLGNLIYEIFRESGTPKAGEDGLPRLGKRQNSTGFWQARVDKARNQQYGGCPVCDQWALTVSWIKLDDGSKAKAIECDACSATFDETNSGLRKVDNLYELDSGGSAVMQELFG